MNLSSYTKKERKEIVEAKKAIFKDLNEIWKNASLKELNVRIDLPGLRDYDYPSDSNINFTIKDNEVVITSLSIFTGRVFYLGKKTISGNLVPNLKIRPEDILFIKNYEEIRKGIIECIERFNSSKDADLEKIRTIRNKYSERIIVGFNLPESINENLIPVRNENGKRIGTIDFGDHAIELVTTSDITLVKQEKEEIIKQKIK